MNHRRIQHGFGGGRSKLVVLAQTTVVAKPGEGAFDYPALGQQCKAVDGLGALDNLKVNLEPVLKTFCLNISVMLE